MLTSTNYDEKDDKIIGGMNGIGAKACNIFSKKFIIETVDASKGLKYSQTFENNMSKKNKPKIKEYTKYPFTKITFYPDLSKFNISNWILINSGLKIMLYGTRFRIIQSYPGNIGNWSQIGRAHV